MTIWLYTERGRIERDGPFFDFEEAMSSPLWMWSLICVWIEERTAHGWIYENLRWDSGVWTSTSRGVRPAELIRPEFRISAKPIPSSPERPRIRIGDRQLVDSCAGICDA